MSAARRCLVSLAVLVAGSSAADAAFTTFYGFDPAAGPGGAHPNSDAARAAFVAALAPGTVGVENFEGDPLVGGVIGVAFPPTGVTGTSTPLANQFASVSGAVDGGFFPTSGTNFYRLQTSSNTAFFDLLLSAPVTAIGFYGADFSNYQSSGVSSPPIRLSLDGGSPIDTLNVAPQTIPGGSVNFFGVITDTPFTTIRLINSGLLSDGIAIDDIIVGQVAPAAVPEPASVGLVVAGVVGLLGYARRQRASRA